MGVLTIVIVGIDTSSRGVAWAALTVNGALQATGAMVDDDANPDVRRITLFFSTRRFLRDLPDGSHVFCEEPLALKNGKTTRLLGLAAGAIWAASLERDLYWHWVDVASWKKAIVGHGNATKEQVRAWAVERHGATVANVPVPDVYDALAVAHYGLAVVDSLEAA